LARELQEFAATPAHGRLNAVIFPETVKINVKTRIRYDGKEYSDPNQLPPKVRAAYEKAIANDVANKKIVVNGRELTNQKEDARNLCDDVMSVIENNGEVTLPSGRPAEPLFGKRQRQLFLLVVGALIFVGVLSRAKMFN
jgi:hypothetical protein